MDIFTFFVLLLIIVFVYSLLGVELFSHDLKIDSEDRICEPSTDKPLLIDPYLSCESPRLNFDNFLNAVVCVFVCLIGEDWQLIMHKYVRSHKSRLSPYLYFISLMVIGHLFLMNLFLAILLKNFEDKGDEANEDEDNEGTNDVKVEKKELL